MAEKIVSVETAGFAFCRYSIAVLVWAAWFLRLKWIIVLVFLILGASAILTVEYAPMILLWRYSFGKIFKSKTELLNVKAMRFAHIMGTVLGGICIVLLYLGLVYPAIERIGWGFVGLFAILKTISALGFCPASKLYSCMSSGSCCALSGKIAGNKGNGRC